MVLVGKTTQGGRIAHSASNWEKDQLFYHHVCIVFDVFEWFDNHSFVVVPQGYQPMAVEPLILQRFLVA